MAVNPPPHGGDLLAAELRWGRPQEGWLDLSTGINPWPYPLPDIPAAAWRRLPGAAEDRALRHAAAAAWNVPDPAMIVAAPGSQPLIQAVPRMAGKACKVAVIGPTYAEHARAWSAAGHDVRAVASADEAGDADAVVAVNPNNPDGRIIAPDRLADLAERLHRRQGLLVVDEAFAETCPQVSLASQPRPGLVVLRSFGKFHGLAGLRLGFAIAMPDATARLAEMLGPWAVSGPALEVGRRALEDRAWAEATRPRLAEAAAALARSLERVGFQVMGGTTLFQLARHAEAAARHDRLGRAGILARAFADRPDLLRFGLPGDAAARTRLDRALG
ncbi:threonine-phosphate decarboxylase CobD [Magnetospirillum sp. SS-4]|uniref:threonine-phosphate decarboxylase CobD n=1 Tax=Magnetospirillum sp. SS-4 TaxID=2681465 RepID=UPI00137D3E7B|nr:threonine-phosphate decarboxylase CobD [Magnetospirillum sp. SS-4]CAA7612494.1 Threonine-phosphate decarboxylase [Magnetospirillum sp. SS-4]